MTPTSKRKRTRFLTAAIVLLMVPAAMAQVGGAGATGTASQTGDASVSETIEGSGDADVSGDASSQTSTGVDSAVDADTTTSVETSFDAQIDATTQAEAQAEAAYSTALDAEARAEAEARATSTGLFGAFQADGETRTGAFVNTNLAADSAAVMKHRVDGTLFVDDLRLSGEFQEHLDAGAEAHAWTTDGHMQLSDNAAGTILVEADNDATVEFATQAATTAGGNILWIEAEGQKAAIAILGEGSIESQADGSFKMMMSQGSQMRFEADDGSADWQAEQVAYAQGELGAEAAIIATGDATVTQGNEYGVEIDIVKATSEEIEAEVSSDQDVPRAIRFEIDQALAADDVQVALDGQAMTRVDTAAEVYGATEPVYTVAQANGHVEVLANVDSFSTHTLSIQPAGQSSEPAGEDAPGFAIVSVLGLIGLAALRRH